MTGAPEVGAERHRALLETEALRLIHDGYSTGQIEERTGVGPTRLRELLRDFPGSGPASRECPSVGCGQPRVGRAPTGWVKVHPESGFVAWFCGWPCVIRRGRQELARRAKERRT